MDATSWSQVCGFIATIRSTPPRRPRWFASEMRTSNQVGRPWMLDGKMLRAATGTPMRRIDLANRPLAEAEPEPFTFANLTTKSLVRAIGVISFRRDGWHGRRRLRQGHVEQELLHVPRAGRAALGAKAAVQADVLVLHHHPPGGQRAGDVEVLGRVRRRRVEPRAQVGLVAVFGEGDAVHRADVD